MKVERKHGSTFEIVLDEGEPDLPTGIPFAGLLAALGDVGGVLSQDVIFQGHEPRTLVATVDTTGATILRIRILISCSGTEYWERQFLLSEICAVPC